MSSLSFPLQRFLDAQERDYERALAELSAGRKETHWIWYVLPQLRELGQSQMAKAYGIAGRDEAVAYLAHPLLGSRLVACVDAVLAHPDKEAVDIFGVIDGMKFKSCLTLFAAVAPDEPVFSKALDVFYRGTRDERTMLLLGSDGAPSSAARTA